MKSKKKQINNLLIASVLLGAALTSNSAFAISCGTGNYGNSRDYSAGSVAFSVEWNVCGNSDSELEMKMTGTGEGWIGVGFSDDQFMASSDTIIGGLNNNAGYLYDTWSFGHTNPAEDTSQDVTLVSASEENGNTIVEFTRALVTGDTAEDFSLDVPRYLMWAIGPIDYTGAHIFDNHGASNRGVSSGMIDFSAPVPLPAALPFMLTGLAGLFGMSSRKKLRA